MGTCFVMQPFDRGVYDKRYEDIFVPAIEAAGLEPYRIDRDPGVSIPIDEIQTGIKNSDVCLAEITTDNPNEPVEKVRFFKNIPSTDSKMRYYFLL